GWSVLVLLVLGFAVPTLAEKALQTAAEKVHMATLSLGMLGAIAFALYMIGVNPRFYLNNISIEGADIIESSAILQASGLQGAHIFAIEPDVAATLINAIPGVLSAQVELRWPDDMDIIIKEDTPVITWNEAGQEYWVNADGALVPAFGQSFDLMKIIAEVPAAAAPLIIETSNPEQDQEDNGPVTYYRFVPHEVMDGAIQLQTLLPELAVLTYKPSGGLHYLDPQGWTAKFGTGDMHVKVATYHAMVAMLNEQGVRPEYIDVSIAAKPVYKPAFGEVSGQ
ncbi:MAG: cell division protein FtsQ/DivIB, partial [Candidatus Promineifilaceae bacterium]